MSSDLMTLTDRLHRQIQTYHDGSPNATENVTYGNLVGSEAAGLLNAAVHEEMPLEEALARIALYTDFDVTRFLQTYPEQFGELLSDLGSSQVDTP